MRDMYCSVCEEHAEDCQCADGGHFPERVSKGITVSVTYPDCSHTVSILTDTRIPETCPACATGIPEGATRCEDYPCCGHTDGDGCMPRPEHTSAYWSRLMSTMDPDDYDAMIERMEERY
jgi:hypothetical protein